MTLPNRVLLRLSAGQLRRNRQFKDRHKGESCYLIGNGASLKVMDLARFSDRIAIGCNALFVHRDFSRLDCRYYQIPTPYFFYRYRKFYGRWRRNYLDDLYREKMAAAPRTCFFTSISNRPNLSEAGVHYTHHFGLREWELGQCALDGPFSFMNGATYAMIGTALYMGFTRAALVGVDYAFTPPHSGHFFEKGPGQAGPEDPAGYCQELFQACRDRIELTTITPEGSQSRLDFTSYSEFTGTPQRYRENTELVTTRDLDYLHRQDMYQIH